MQYLYFSQIKPLEENKKLNEQARKCIKLTTEVLNQIKAESDETKLETNSTNNTSAINTSKYHQSLEYVPSTESLVWIASKETPLTHYLVQLLIQQYAIADAKPNTLGYVPEENFVHVTDSTSVNTLNNIAKEPPFLGKYYILTGNLTKLSRKVRSKLLQILKLEKPYIKAFINIEFKDYIEFKDSKKLEKTGKLYYMYRMDYDLLMSYANSLGVTITTKALYRLVKRTETTSLIVFYLYKLSTYGSLINKENINKLVPNCVKYSLLDYLEATLNPTSKTVHVKALDECLTMYKAKTHSTILKHLTILLELKDLYDNGYIMSVNLKSDFQKLKTGTVKTKSRYNDSAKTSQLSEALETSSTVTIKRLLQICSSISKEQLNFTYYLYSIIKPTAQNLFILTELIYSKNISQREMTARLRKINTSKPKYISDTSYNPDEDDLEDIPETSLISELYSPKTNTSEDTLDILENLDLLCQTYLDKKTSLNALFTNYDMSKLYSPFS